MDNNINQFSEQDNNGNIVKKVGSELGDDYEVIDEKIDLTELPKKEYDALMYSDKVRKSRKIKKRIKDVTVWYGWGSTIVDTVKIFI